jgi:hypothetical protein
VTVLYATLVGLGLVMCIGAVVWSVRTRHERKLWRTARHDASTVALVLELEDRVQELENRVRTLDRRSTPVR